jgi:hypothetical protein
LHVIVNIDFAVVTFFWWVVFDTALLAVRECNAMREATQANEGFAPTAPARRRYVP